MIERARRGIGAMLVLVIVCCGLSCHAVRHLPAGAAQGAARPGAPPSPRPGPFVILFAIDGAGYDQFMQAVGSGKAPHIASLLGERRGADTFAHAYSAPEAITIMPSCSTAGWTSIMTGRAPAATGLAGDEFFVRRENRFYAPIPISTRAPEDFFAAIDHDLIGKILRVPTVYQSIKGQSFVSLLYVY